MEASLTYIYDDNLRFVDGVTTWNPFGGLALI